MVMMGREAINILVHGILMQRGGKKCYESEND
jgi:hypothetical protein